MPDILLEDGTGDVLLEPGDGFILLEAFVANSSLLGNGIRYFGSGGNANDVLFATGDLPYDSFLLMSTAGAVQVYGSLDGINFSSAPISLQDMGAVTTAPVIVTAAGRIYGFRGRFLAIEVTQNGALASAASMIAWKR